MPRNFKTSKLRYQAVNKLLFPEMVCNIPGNNSVFLTFDDGPTPEITDRVLAFLLQYHAKATFFCIGNKVEQFPELYQTILNEGHSVGNHGYNHLHGWYTTTKTYLDDCQRASQLIKSNLFRPPYGKLTRNQYRSLLVKYRIVHWSALSWDFHPWISQDRCLRIALNSIYNGSILVFHDTWKAEKKLFYVLPRLLEEIQCQGYSAESISELV
jgi:peptidoglycan-N-acetylglucosamine deacetylase